MTTASVSALFAELRRELVPIAQRSSSSRPPTTAACTATFAEPAQLAFGLAVVAAFGYDLDRGRLDKTHHPFCTTFSIGDVRITTRVYQNDVGQALFSTLHESGHAMYEQGVSPGLDGTPLGSGTSAGVHESQSRLWENVVGRSRGFWQHFYPALQSRFPDQLGDVPLETFYRAINKVERSLIRTDADEVTYNLHVMMRFDLELDLLEGRLAGARICPRPGARASRPISASRPPTIATAACRTCIGIRAASAAPSRATRSAMFSAPSSMTRRSRRIRTFPPRSPRASSGRCMAGCARTSIGMAASSRRTRSSSARPARR